MADTTPSKLCRKCGVVKPFSYFSIRAASNDGLATRCKSCLKEARSQQDYDVSVLEKGCTKCKVVKPSGEFSPNRKNKSGLSGWCKACYRQHGCALNYGVDTSIAEKRCTACESVKPIDQFSRSRQSKDGFQSACKCCQRERHRDWYERNSESVIARTKLWAANNPDKYKALSRNRQRRRLYGLTSEQYNRLLAVQEGKCAGCAEDFTATPHVDHDHVTGAVRGLLCGACNKALGMALDSPTRLLGLVQYLHRHQEDRTIA